MIKIKKVTFESFFLSIVGIISVCTYSTIVNFNNCIGLEKFGVCNRLIVYFSWFIPVIIIGYIFIKGTKKIYISIPAVYLSGFNIYILFMTFIHSEDIFSKTLLSNLVMIIFIDVLLCEKKQDVFRTIINFYNFLIILNFLGIIFLRNTRGFLYYNPERAVYMQDIYFFGYDNCHIVCLLPLICINMCMYRKTKLKKYICASIISIVGVFVTFSVTSIVIVGIWMILYIVYWVNPKLIKALMNEKLLCGGVLICFVIFIWNKGYAVFINILESIFEKNMASVRGKLYSIGIDQIKNSIFFGYGFNSTRTSINGFASPHNMILAFWYIGGILCAAGFMCLLWQGIKSIRKNINYDCANILGISILSFLIGFMAESYEIHCSFWLFLTLLLFAMRIQEFNEII